MLQYWAGNNMASMYTVSVQTHPPHMRFVSGNVSIMNFTALMWLNIHKSKVHSVVRPYLFFRN